jgi:hypothetical protein
VIGAKCVQQMEVWTIARRKSGDVIGARMAVINPTARVRQWFNLSALWPPAYREALP